MWVNWVVVETAVVPFRVAVSKHLAKTWFSPEISSARAPVPPAVSASEVEATRRSCAGPGQVEKPSSRLWYSVVLRSARNPVR
jgi:hypothetical protein